MLISYQLPCSYSFYSDLANNQEVSQSLCSIISGNSIAEVIHPNLTIQNLQFKKFMLLEPRYFHYLKYHNSSGSSHWEVCLSTKSKPNTNPSEKECEITSISCFEESKGHLAANVYLEIDLKSNIRARKVVHRVCEEVARYCDNLWSYARENYSEVSA